MQFPDRRITPADIEEFVIDERYINVGDVIHNHKDEFTKTQLGLLTICVLVLKNGFTVTGESACAFPANFDNAIGRKIAREKAIEKVWPLLGFMLRDQLYEQEQGR
jgi:hypothetical protein